MDLNAVNTLRSPGLCPNPIASGAAGQDPVKMPDDTFQQGDSSAENLIDPKKLGKLDAASLLELTDKGVGIKEVWKVDLGKFFDGESGVLTPIVREDGIYFSFKGKTSKYSHDGEEIWSKATGGTKNKTPVFDDKGNVYVLSSGFDGTEAFLNCLDKDGNPKWIESAGDYASADKPILKDGMLYTSCSDGRVNCFNLEGKEEWAVHVRDAKPYTMEMDTSGKLHFNRTDDLSGEQIHMVVDPSIRDEGNRPRVTEIGKWKYSDSPMVYPDGTLYGVKDGKYRAWDSTGKELWSKDIPGGGEHVNEVRGPDGNIYVFAMNPDTLACLKPDGTAKWTFQGDGKQEDLSNTYAWGPDGTMYVLGGGDNHRVYALNPDGSVKWTSQKLGSEPGNINVGPDGIIYTGDKDSKVRGFSPETGLKLFEHKENGAIFTSPDLKKGDFLVLTEEGRLKKFHYTDKEEFKENFDTIAREQETKPEITREKDSVDIDGAKLGKRKKRFA